MKPITREWIDKAEGDWTSAGLLYRARKQPNYDAACFHSQQSAEKYLKARLVEAGITFSKTHNLIALLALATPLEPSWTTLQPQLRTLTSMLSPIVILAVPRQKPTRAPQYRTAGMSGGLCVTL